MNISDFISQENIDKRIDAEKAIGRLTHIEKAVLYLYVTGHNQEEIGGIIGYSQRHISRILQGITEKQTNFMN